MKINDYSKEDERKIIRALQEENRLLRSMLKRQGQIAPASNAFETAFRNEEYDPDQGGRIRNYFINDEMANHFFLYFWGRKDVFAKRGKKGGYYPKCSNAFKEGCPKINDKKSQCPKDCPKRNWKKLEIGDIKNHLIGSREDGTDAIGVYPLLPDNTCRFLVFDFDNHEKGSEQNDFANRNDDWKDEVDALRLVLTKNKIPFLTERSRSGKGAHLWIFFREPIDAGFARQFGYRLLEIGYSEVNYRSFKYFDRMFPAQDYVDSDGIGNLIALPLQGGPLKDGNTAFVDASWNAYEEQWKVLFETERLSKERLISIMQLWDNNGSLGTAFGSSEKRIKPWEKNDSFHSEDVDGELHIVLADGIYVDALNLKIRIQNQIRSLAAIRNPEFYKKLRLKQFTGYDFMTLSLGEDKDGYIHLPRGLFDVLVNKCKEAGIDIDVVDKRQQGKPLRIRFEGKLYDEQELAVQSLLHYDTGILNAATAFGKTVVCASIIARKKTSTLILLNSASLMKQWKDRLDEYLSIDEKLPEYTTKTGKVKTRDSVIGTLQAGNDKLTGIIDIAMTGSMYSKGKFNERLTEYGLVIMDECHHAASNTAKEVIQRVRAKYVYGVTATPIRGDSLEKINYMLLGPVRHEFSARQRAEKTGIKQLVIPRFTRLLDPSGEGHDINHAYELTRDSKVRNEQVINDVCCSISEHRTPVILTRYKEHAEFFAKALKDKADHVFLLYGGNSQSKENEIIEGIKNAERNESIILVATAQKIGEGFDFPRLDTLFLAVPVSFSGRLSQYVGRLAREYEGKKDMIVYDYVDPHLPVFDSMYSKRLAAYRKLGFSISQKEHVEKQNADSIYNGRDYLDIFERDLNEAEKQIIIASPEITIDKAERLIHILKDRQEAGTEIIIITSEPDDTRYSDSSFIRALFKELSEAGIIVKTKADAEDHFAVIDNELVWYGGMNLLGKADVWDNLIRIKDISVAAELLELSEK